MIKKLVFLMTVCVVARFCFAETTTQSTIRIKNVNDRESMWNFVLKVDFFLLKFYLNANNS